MDVHNWETGYFIQDDWKITPRLTLNLGVRYELITPFVDTNDLIANFDPEFRNATTGAHGRFVIPSEKDAEISGYQNCQFRLCYARPIGSGRWTRVVRMDKNNFAPRLGLAWRITDKKRVPRRLRRVLSDFRRAGHPRSDRDQSVQSERLQSGLRRATRFKDGRVPPARHQPMTPGALCKASEIRRR